MGDEAMPLMIFDVGLHKGEDTDFYLRKGFRVVAFEANPGLIHYCKVRFAPELASGQLTIIEGAIIDPAQLENGQTSVPFYFDEASSMSGSVTNDWAAPQAALLVEIDVETVDFGAVVEEQGMPYYLKVDIEGADRACLEALARFDRRPEYVSLEASRDSYEAICHELDLLESLGYEAFQAVEQSGIPQVQSPPDPAREGDFVEHAFEYGASGLFGRELPGKWRSVHEIKRFYRFVWMGHYLLGNAGVLYRWQFRGASRLRRLVRWGLERLTRANVPGWYDTHARHRDAGRADRGDDSR